MELVIYVPDLALIYINFQYAGVLQVPIIYNYFYNKQLFI